MAITLEQAETFVSNYGLQGQYVLITQSDNFWYVYDPNSNPKLNAFPFGQLLTFGDRGEVIPNSQVFYVKGARLVRNEIVGVITK